MTVLSILVFWQDFSTDSRLQRASTALAMGWKVALSELGEQTLKD